MTPFTKCETFSVENLEMTGVEHEFNVLMELFGMQLATIWVGPNGMGTGVSWGTARFEP